MTKYSTYISFKDVSEIQWVGYLVKLIKSYMYKININGGVPRTISKYIPWQVGQTSNLGQFTLRKVTLITVSNWKFGLFLESGEITRVSTESRGSEMFETTNTLKRHNVGWLVSFKTCNELR